MEIYCVLYHFKQPYKTPGRFQLAKVPACECGGDCKVSVLDQGVVSHQNFPLPIYIKQQVLACSRLQVTMAASVQQCLNSLVHQEISWYYC